MNRAVSGLLVAGLQLVGGPSVISIGTGNGANQGCVVHLLGDPRKNFTDLDPACAGLDGLEKTGSGASRFWIPGIDVAHPASIPEENDLLSTSGTGCCGEDFPDWHSEEGRERGYSAALEHAAAGHVIILAAKLLVHIDNWLVC